ncbi:MAG: hypothetical protein M3481_07950 [Actinomycetota bacterium]|nr:hypothetical protein [Actinomycetota bacterium]
MNGPVPARVDTSVKDVLLGLIDHAVAAGWPLAKACRLLDLQPRRAHRWLNRRDRRDLADHPPGSSLNALLPGGPTTDRIGRINDVPPAVHPGPDVV